MKNAYSLSPARTGLLTATLLPAIAWAFGGCMGSAQDGTGPEATAALMNLGSPLGDANCAYGSADCNTCVNDVQGAFLRISSKPTAQIRYKSGGGATLPPFNEKLAKFDSNEAHVQGIVRLSGVGSDTDPNGRGPWFALTRANPGHTGGSGMFTVQLADLPTHGGFAIETSATGEPPGERGTKAYFPILGLDHAGGLQAIGQHVVIASSCDKCAENGFLHTYNLADPTSGNAWETALRIGDQGEPGDVHTVTSAAMVKLASGQFLAFILGKDSTHEGWFYVSDGTVLSGATRWIYGGYWQRPLGGSNEYQNTQFVTECGTGDIYMIGSGNADFDGSVDDIAQVAFGITPGKDHLSLLKLGPSDSAVATMDVVNVRDFHPGDGDYCTFRAGASVHVTPDHNLVVYCTTRKSNESLFGKVDSKLKMEEYAPR